MASAQRATASSTQRSSSTDDDDMLPRYQNMIVHPGPDTPLPPADRLHDLPALVPQTLALPVSAAHSGGRINDRAVEVLARGWQLTPATLKYVLRERNELVASIAHAFVDPATGDMHMTLEYEPESPVRRLGREALARLAPSLSHQSISGTDVCMLELGLTPFPARAGCRTTGFDPPQDYHRRIMAEQQPRTATGQFAAKTPAAESAATEIATTEPNDEQQPQVTPDEQTILSAIESMPEDGRDAMLGLLERMRAEHTTQQAKLQTENRSLQEKLEAERKALQEKFEAERNALQEQLATEQHKSDQFKHQISYLARDLKAGLTDQLGENALADAGLNDQQFDTVLTENPAFAQLVHAYSNAMQRRARPGAHSDRVLRAIRGGAAPAVESYSAGSRPKREAEQPAGEHASKRRCVSEAARRLDMLLTGGKTFSA
jgi:hypothetical protein